MKKVKRTNGRYNCVEYGCPMTASKDNPRCERHSIAYYSEWLNQSMPSTGRTPVRKDETWD